MTERRGARPLLGSFFHRDDEETASVGENVKA
jgi:hypothetical protein